MRTTSEKPKTIIDYAMQIHLKTSSWVAGMIGPMVFNIGSNDKNWKINTVQLLQYSEGSLGKSLGEFLKKHNVELLAGAEYHDIHHILFDYSLSFRDEVALQFFLHGNGNKSIASISTRIGAWCLLPTEWKYLNAAYKRGKLYKDISIINFKSMLNQDLTQVKASLFK
jgi:hypothetical protein